VRGQLASSLSACAAAEGRSRQLSSQVKERDAALAKMREEHDAVVSSLKQVLHEPSQNFRSSRTRLCSECLRTLLRIHQHI